MQVGLFSRSRRLTTFRRTIRIQLTARETRRARSAQVQVHGVIARVVGGRREAPRSRSLSSPCVGVRAAVPLGQPMMRSSRSQVAGREPECHGDWMTFDRASGGLAAIHFNSDTRTFLLYRAESGRDNRALFDARQSALSRGDAIYACSRLFFRSDIQEDNARDIWHAIRISIPRILVLSQPRDYTRIQQYDFS